MTKRTNIKVENHIVKMYNEGFSTHEIKKFLGHKNSSVIVQILKRYGVKIRNQNFEVFPEDEKILAYICGLIATDGCLSKSRKQIIVTQHIKNEYLLQWLYDTLSSRPNYPKNQKGNCKTFTMGLPKLYEYCINIGITPNKSKTLNIDLSDKSEEFKLWFLRGAIDGDGTFGKDRLYISTASIKFAETLHKEFGGIISKINGSGFKPDTVYYNWSLGTIEDLISLASSLPKMEFMIKSKTEKLNLFLDLPNRNRIYYFRNKYYTFSELQKILNIIVPKNTFRNRVKKYGWSIEDAASKPLKGIYQYRGVGKNKYGWIARIVFKGVEYKLGPFKTEKEAAKRYNREAIKFWGKRAKINLFFDKCLD